MNHHAEADLAVSILPTLGVFTAVFLVINLCFRALGVFINIAPSLLLPFVMVMLMISCYYAIQYFIRKYKRYFMMSELLFICIGSIMSIWVLQAFLDGVLLMNQTLLEALINSSLTLLIQSCPVIFAYAYLGRYMLSRFLAHEADLPRKDQP